MASYDYLDKGNDDGTVLGQKTASKIGFWGITPVDQPSALSTELTTLTLSASATATVTGYTRCITAGWGFVSYPEAQTFMKCVQNVQIRLGELEDRLQEAGILAGGTDAPTKTIYDYVGKGGGGDGTILGQDSSELISFWGITPVNQPTAITKTSTTSLSRITTTISASFTATVEALVSDSAGFGWTSAEAAYSFVNLVKTLQSKIGAIEDNLIEIGLLAGGTGISITTSANLSYLDKGNDDGTILGYATDQLIGFWGTTPADQPAALTAAVTTIETTIDATTKDYSIGGLYNTIGASKFSTVDASNTVLRAMYNAQVRLEEIESRLEEVGLMASN
jgi:hypothetical protein